MSASIWEDPYIPAVSLLEIATDWVSRKNSECLPFALELSVLRHRADWRLSIYRTPQGVKGASIVFSGGDWRMEADDEDSALMLANMAVMDRRIPARLTTSERTAALLRPYLIKTGRLRSEGELICLTCEKPPALREGRWATNDDLAALKEFSAHPAFPATSWEILIAFRELAVLTREGEIVAAAVVSGKTRTLAGVAALGFEPALVGFIASELLRDSPAVQVSVPEAEAEGHSSLGFRASGKRYTAVFS